LWDLAAVGFGNQYYAAAVKSMLRSPSAFVFASFDPEGFVSVDKPPLGLWTQALLAKIVGFSGLILQVPQAIAGTIGVGVLVHIVARDFGLVSALAAGSIAAVMPVAVAVDRNNTMDAQLVLLLLVATYAVLRAVDERPLRWLALAGLLVGLAFNVKMAQAFLPLPAFVLAYLIGARAPLPARVAHLSAFLAITGVASIAWIVFVDLVPADRRPYVGSSRDNSALELALGHNGAERLPQELLVWLRRPTTAPPLDRAVAPLPPPPPGQQGPNDEAGERGALRLFNPQLAGQVTWFIPFAIVGAALAFARDGHRRPLTHAQVSIVLWLAWLVPSAALFSWSGIFHRYYLVMLAPPLAALCGAGCGALVHGFGGSRGRIALAVGALLTAAAQLGIIDGARPFGQWLVPVVGAGAVVAVALAAGASAIPRQVRIPLAALAFTAFLAAPIAWAATAIVSPDGGLPYAGPDLLRRPRPPSPAGAAPSPLLAYLMERHGGERWILAVGSANTAAPLMLQADVAIMALGGFSGGDPILTPERLADTVRSGELRFALIGDRMAPELERWLRERCVPVSQPTAPIRPDGPGVLVDCRSVREGAATDRFRTGP
jgi:4-amino-4-deoxy-L-arabinose transferase-like glycosyltransferase